MKKSDGYRQLVMQQVEEVKEIAQTSGIDSTNKNILRLGGSGQISIDSSVHNNVSIIKNSSK